MQVSSSSPSSPPTVSTNQAILSHHIKKISNLKRFGQLLKVITLLAATFGIALIPKYTSKHINDWWNEFRTGERKVHVKMGLTLKKEDKMVENSSSVKQIKSANLEKSTHSIKKKKDKKVGNPSSKTQVELNSNDAKTDSLRSVENKSKNIPKPDSQDSINLEKKSPSIKEKKKSVEKIEGSSSVTSVSTSTYQGKLPHLHNKIESLKKGDELQQKKAALLERGLNCYLEQNLSPSLEVFTLGSKKEEFIQTDYSPIYFQDIFYKKYRGTWEYSEKFFDYKPHPIGESYWVDFANTRLGGGCFTHGFVQEEVMVHEKPEFADYIASHQSPDPDKNNWCDVLIREGEGDNVNRALNGNPNPLLLKGLHRVQAINNSLAYGSKIEKLPLDELLSSTKSIDPAQKVNLLAIAAPKLYSRKLAEAVDISTLKDIFNTLVAGFTLVKERSTGPFIIHSGKFGCGAFNNDSRMIYLLHYLAAAYTEVNIKMWGYSEREVLEYQPVVDACIHELCPGRTLEDILQRLNYLAN